MKPRPHLTCRLSPLGAVALAVAIVCSHVAAFAEGGRKNPTSKLYVAALTGETQISRGEKIETPNPKTAYNAEGSIIETKAKSTSAMVFSNGTGLALDPDSRIEIVRFQQEAFAANRNDLEVEPSMSQLDALIARGSVGFCTSKLVAGSTMRYRTLLASIMVQGGKLVIESGEDFTRISMLEGEGLVRGGALDLGGQVLKAGQQATIRPGPAREPNVVTIAPIPDNEHAALDDHVFLACTARKTVFFDTRDTGDSTEVVPVPVVPASLPTPITVSPSKLPQ